MSVVPEGAKLAAGLLPFFEEGKTILLGYEYREREGADLAMEFGGKVDPGESFAQTARREAWEESNGIIDLDVADFEAAERMGDYIDYYNPKSNVFYRMYCLLFDSLLDISGFTPDKAHVEKHKVVYWPAREVLYNESWTLPDGVEIYPTSRTRYTMLKDKTLSWMM